MRQLGYPPGWLNELQANNQSELVLFDFEGKNTFDQKVKVQELDPDKIIEYAGFNVPLAKGLKDVSCKDLETKKVLFCLY